MWKTQTPAHSNRLIIIMIIIIISITIIKFTLKISLFFIIDWFFLYFRWKIYTEYFRPISTLIACWQYLFFSCNFPTFFFDFEYHNHKHIAHFWQVFSVTIIIDEIKKYNNQTIPSFWFLFIFSYCVLYTVVYKTVTDSKITGIRSFYINSIPPKNHILKWKKEQKQNLMLWMSTQTHVYAREFNVSISKNAKHLVMP